MDIDQAKIIGKLNELNSNQSDGDWLPVDGFHSMVTTDLTSDKINFMIGSGLVTKAFLNRKTGELKTFPAKMFERINEQ